MKILKLRFQNLNSLVGEHEIDFEKGPLANQGLFAIVGSTGAGKTTILDGITLALYGQAARHQKKGKNAGEMMSRNTAECYAEAEFEIPKGRFRARWELRRSRGKADGEFQPTKRLVDDLRSRKTLVTKVREVDAWIEQNTGLDYERFLRSVLLAQGEFAAFLKASDNQRGDLLQRITGTEIYAEVSALAFELAKEKKEEVARAHTDLNVDDLLTDEIIHQLKHQQTKANEEIPRLEKRLHEMQRRIELVKRSALLAKEIADNGKAQETAAERIKKAEQALKQVRAEHEKASASLALFRKLLEKLLPLRERFEQQQQQVTNQKATREALVKKDAEIAKLMESLSSDEKKAASLNAASTLALEKDEKEIADLLGGETLVSLGELRKPKNARVEHLRSLFGKSRDFENHQKSMQGLSERLKAMKPTLETIRKQIVDVEDQLGKQETLVEAKEALVFQAAKVADLEGHRGDLVAGEPCALCGSREHPFVSGSEPLPSPLQAAQADLAKTRKEVAGLQTTRGKYEADLQKVAGENAEAEGSLKTLKSTADTLAGSFSDDVFEIGDLEEIKKAGVAEKEVLDALDMRLSKVAKRQTTVEAQRKKHQLAVSSWEKLKHRLSEETRRLEETRRERDSAVEKQRDLQQATDQVKSEMESVLKLHDTEWSRKAQGLADLGVASIDDEKRAREARFQETEIAKKEKESQHNTAVTEREKLVAVAGNQQKEHKENLLEVERLQQGENELNLEALEQQSETLGVQRDELKQSLWEAKKALEEDETKRKKLEDSREKLVVLEKEALRWEKLSAMIGSSKGEKFARFAQGLTLSRLITLANGHLETLTDRYRMQRLKGQDLELQIVDLYQANAERSMSSLSGGESFLASLALALGLSDLAGQRASIKSLFIDEGFGTLDGNTLDIAITALENLQAQDKTIGIISHVEPLKERISTQIVVKKGTKGTSSISITDGSTTTNV